MWKDTKLPWDTQDYDDDIIYALRALVVGKANEGQQKYVWQYLMYLTKASEEFASLSFRPDNIGGERATAFAEGKRFVGLMLRKLFRPELTPHAQHEDEDPVPTRRRRRATAKQLAR